MRKLELTTAGKWYLALTIAMGVLALSSGNNSLYLVESLLLSGLILSGILSERIVAAVQFNVHHFPVSAGEPSHDRITIINEKNYPLFCFEVGEWKNGKFYPLSYIARLHENGRTTVGAHQTLLHRGIHTWDGLAIATSYPFGFARKIRVIRTPGQRVVWPAQKKLPEKKDRYEEKANLHRSGSVVSEGEVRPWAEGDDPKTIIWTLSARGSDLVVRPLKKNEEAVEVKFDLRKESKNPDFENRIITLAEPFYRENSEKGQGVLTLVDGKQILRFRGKRSALDQLATLKPKVPL